MRALSEPLAEHCHALLSQLWLVDGLIIPSCWKHAWLTLLAKRTVKSPKDIRPIALTDLLGKTVLSLIVMKPKRSTADALILAFAHLRTTCQACQQASSTVWQRRDGGHAHWLAGGCCLSLDLSEAFDRLPRHLLREGFDLTPCPPSLIALLQAWLTDARYTLSHRGEGCVASPLEWNVFTFAVFDRLQNHPAWGHEWILAHLLAFADDLLRYLGTGASRAWMMSERPWLTLARCLTFQSHAD